MAAQRSREEQIRALEDKRRKLDAQLARLHAAGRAEARKRDTRRKILAGAAVLNQAEKNDAARASLWKLLDQALVKDRDRELFDLPAAKETSR